MRPGLAGCGLSRRPASRAGLARRLLQFARVWIITTLGRRWTTRVIVLPGAPLVARGPYRFLRHPNYLVVAAEIAVVPLALGQPLYALVFSALNAVVLAVRIRVENAALAGKGGVAGSEGVSRVR